MSRDSHDIRQGEQIRRCLNVFWRGSEPFPPGDILSGDGTPLLSWRVAFLLENEKSFPEYRDKNFSFNTDEPWDTSNNLKAAETKPDFFMYPYHLETKNSIKTCVVLIKEVAELKRTGQYDDQIRDKALIVLLAPEDAVPWTAPVDVSWKDLAAGRIKAFNRNGYFFYVKCGDITMEYLKRHPQSYEEWAKLCDVENILVGDKHGR